MAKPSEQHSEDDTIFPATTAILLAAGESRRMGIPKPLLLKDNLPLIVYLVRTLQLGGVETILVVTNPSLSDVILTALSFFQKEIGIDRVSVVINSKTDATMLTSIQVGLDRIDETQAFLVCPVDLPLLTPASVYAILNCWYRETMRRAQAIVVPTCNGKRGHPTLFGREWPDRVLSLNADEVGLNFLLKQENARVTEVAVEDEGVLRDGDTREEWERLTGGPPVCWHAE